MLAPERCFEVVADEFDGPVEAFVGWDVEPFDPFDPFDKLRAGKLRTGRLRTKRGRKPFVRLRINNIRHVFRVRDACALARI